ncbi:MAG: ABC transporter permease [Clostridia bacterium]
MSHSKVNHKNSAFGKITDILPEYACIAVLALVLIVASILSPAFFSGTNLQNVLKQGAVLAVLATGMGFVLISGCIDLSVGINMAICALVSVVLQKYVGTALSILAAILVGMSISSINMFIIYITKARAIEIMMITFGLKMAYRGLAQAVTGNAAFREETSDFFRSLGKGMTFGTVPNIVIVMAGVCIVLGIVLAKTKFGRQVVSVGVNPEATRLSGTSVTKTRFQAFLICGACAAIAGILLASRTMAIKALSGDDYEMQAMSALVIGGFAVFGGFGSVWRVVVGVYVYSIISNILNLVGAGAFEQKLAQGVILILAVWMDVYLRVKRSGGK